MCGWLGWGTGLGHWSLCCAKGGDSGVLVLTREAWRLVRWKAEVVWLGGALEAT